MNGFRSRNWLPGLAGALCAALVSSAPGGAAAQNAPCIAAATLKQLNTLVDDAETIVEARLQNTIAQAAVQTLAVSLADGRILLLPPAGTTPEATKLAKSIDKLAQKQQVVCSASTALNCVDPFADRIAQQGEDVDGAAGIFTDLVTRVRAIQRLPDFDTCVNLGDKRTLKLVDLEPRMSEARRRLLATNDLVRALERAGNSVVVQCKKPDILSCTAQLPPAPALEPNQTFARRKLKNKPLVILPPPLSALD